MKSSTFWTFFRLFHCRDRESHCAGVREDQVSLLEELQVRGGFSGELHDILATPQGREALFPVLKCRIN